MNVWVLGGGLANWLIAASLHSTGELPTLAALLLATAAVYSLGVALILTGRQRLGARVVMLASVVFVPIGWIGVRGGCRVLDRLAARELELQRARLCRPGTIDPARSMDVLGVD